jgi:predicted ester cyclase
VSESNKDVAKRAWAAYAGGDVEGFASCLTDDWVEHGPDGDTSGLADNLDVIRRHRESFPDKRAEVIHEVAEGDLVAQHVVVSATHTGRYLDLEPTGKHVRIVEMMIHRMRGGRIAESWEVTYGAGFYEQLTGHRAPESRENIG